MLYFLRHGESEANVLGVFSNRGFQHGLTEKGIKQAEECREKLSSIAFQAIYTSPLQRTVETARIVSRGRGVEVQVEPRLVEFDVGVLEGRGDPESWQTFSGLWKEWFLQNNHRARLDGGESLEDVHARFFELVEHVGEQQQQDPQAHFLFVSHGGTLSCTLPFLFTDFPAEIIRSEPLGNCQWVTGFLQGDQWYCHRWGQTLLHELPSG